MSEVDPLDPVVLAASAETLLGRCTTHEERVALVVSLLRDVREDRQRENFIRDGYSRSYRQLQEEHGVACDERNMYREALRIVKHATRDVRVGRRP